MPDTAARPADHRRDRRLRQQGTGRGRPGARRPRSAGGRRSSSRSWRSSTGSRSTWSPARCPRSRTTSGSATPWPARSRPPPPLAGVVLLLPAGRLADSGRRTAIVALVVLVWSACSVLSGLATTFALFFVTRILLGAAGQLYNPPASSLLADYYPSPDPGQGLRARAGRLLHRPPGRSRARRRARRGARLARRLLRGRGPGPAHRGAGADAQGADPRHRRPARPAPRAARPAPADEHAVHHRRDEHDPQGGAGAARDPHPQGRGHRVGAALPRPRRPLLLAAHVARAHREPRLRRGRGPGRRSRRHGHRHRHHPRQPDRRPRPRHAGPDTGSAPPGRSCCSARSRSPPPSRCPACR